MFKNKLRIKLLSGYILSGAVRLLGLFKYGSCEVRIILLDL